MTAQRWWRLAAVAAALYVMYEIEPVPLPDLPPTWERIVVATLVVALVLSGTAELIKRYAAGERERRLADAQTAQCAPVRWVGRATIVHIDDSTLSGYDRGYADGLARRPMDDGGGAARRHVRRS